MFRDDFLDKNLVGIGMAWSLSEQNVHRTSSSSITLYPCCIISEGAMGGGIIYRK